MLFQGSPWRDQVSRAEIKLLQIMVAGVEAFLKAPVKSPIASDLSTEM